VIAAPFFSFSVHERHLRRSPRRLDPGQRQLRASSNGIEWVVGAK
jgi:hypothetical protein